MYTCLEVGLKFFCLEPQQIYFLECIALQKSVHLKAQIVTSYFAIFESLKLSTNMSVHLKELNFD